MVLVLVGTGAVMGGSDGDDGVGRGDNNLVVISGVMVTVFECNKLPTNLAT